MRAPRPVRGLLLPVVVAVAVAGTAVGVGSLVRSGAARQAAGVDAPPVLHLDGVGGGPQSGTKPRGIPSDEPTDLVRGLAGGGYRLAGDLLDGPASAWAYRLPAGQAGLDDVRRVATALGLAGTPRRTRAGWVVFSGRGRLVVQDAAGQPWSFGVRGCRSGLPTRSAVAAIACPLGAVRPPLPRPCLLEMCPLPQPPPGLVTSRAREFFAALGADAIPFAVDGATATANPDVEGVPTADWPLSVTVGEAGTVTAAAGHLGRPVRLASYPIVSADEAFVALQKRPRPLPEVCQLRIDPSRSRSAARRAQPRCLPLTPTVVTGARLGLDYVLADRGALLVPAWLFSVRGDAQPIPQIAIAARYLAGNGIPGT